MIKIKEVFFTNVAEMFDSTLEKIQRDLNIPNEDFAIKINPILEPLIEKYNDIFVKAHLDNHKFKIEDFIENHSKNQKKIIEENSEIFTNFILYINSSHIIFEKWTKSLDGKKKSKIDGISVGLYGIIVRRSEQIVSLLIDGYIDASMIIWRSLYENAIALMTLLKENDEELIEKFSDHSIKNKKNKIESYTKNFEDLKFQPLPNQTFENLQIEEERILTKYGKSFLKNEFGWADDLFSGNERASLRLLEIRLNLNRYRPYYLMCSEHTHLGYNGFNDFKTGNTLYLNNLTRQNIEKKKFIDPMQFTISILHDVNNTILYEISEDIEYEVNIKMLKEITLRFSNTISTTE